MLRKTPLRKTSEKQRAKNAEWNRITDEKCRKLDFVCQWCGKKGHRDKGRYEDWFYLTGHHKKKRRFNVQTKENCYLCHLICHSEIEESSVDVNIFKNREEWEAQRKSGGM